MVTISGVMSGVFLVSMLYVSGRAGYTYGDDMVDVDAALTESKQKQSTLEAQFQALLIDQSSLKPEIKTDIIKNLDDVIELQDKIRIARANASARFVTIQTTGIVFIAFIIFLYILKAFGFLHDIDQAFAGLFKGKRDS